jgi:hypothetical protein
MVTAWARLMQFHSNAAGVITGDARSMNRRSGLAGIPAVAQEMVTAATADGPGCHRCGVNATGVGIFAQSDSLGVVSSSCSSVASAWLAR